MKRTSFTKALVVCDRKLKNTPFIQSWLKNPKFSFYFVSAGEGTKSIERLPIHLKTILSLSKSYGKDQLVFVSLGGGSIEDLTGFLSSIYKRGFPLIHIPTTWLAALDSAHGGKNALNFLGIKNIVGTYHFPQAVFIVEEILNTLPPKQKQMAFGELLKMALIEGGSFYRELCACLVSEFMSSQFKTIGFPIRKGKLKCTYQGVPSVEQKKEFSSIPADKRKLIDWQEFPWEKFLKKGIAAKMKIVCQDPFEKKTLRRLLNFGHTIGHILEAAYGIPHGEAVLSGMLFSIRWSMYKKLLSKKNFYEIQYLISSFSDFNKKPLSLSHFKKYLEQDKKSFTHASLEFVFIKRPGFVIIKKVRKEEIIREAQRQGLVKKNGK